MATASLLLGLVTRLWVIASSAELLKGISYGPSPLKGKGKLPNDDFMSESAKAQWSSSGRGDLEVMKKLGANAVRLYGNDPRENHKPFLDEAQKQGLEVIPGLSDYPYTQMPGNCQTTDYNCYSQIKEQYTSNLKNGFVDDEGSYHPALKHVIVLNEPDLKLPGISEPVKFCRGLISAIDAMVDAEKDVGATKNLPNFTVTFSFAVCKACADSSKPSVGQMLSLKRAMENPKDFGYTPNNDLANIYKTRFTNSFNTNNPATDMKPLFLDDYETHFSNVPVFIGEYHAPHTSVGKDLQAVLNIAASSKVLLGVAFFEYQVRYDKGGSEMEFGMFGLGTVKVGQMNYFGVHFDVWCLTVMADKLSAGSSVASEVASTFGGPGVNANELCVIDPQKVPISEDGYQAVLTLKSTDKMADFISRVVQHMGGMVSDQSGLHTLAAKYSGQTLSPERATTADQEVLVEQASAELSLAAMASELGQHPAWVHWDTMSACVADRTSDESSVGQALAYACGKLYPSFDCAKGIPEECGKDSWTKADYIFSLYYLSQVNDSSPLQHCNFEGAAMFAPAKTYRDEDSSCVITKDPNTTALSEQGYGVILEEKSASKVASFIEREVAAQHMQVTDESALHALAQHPPGTFSELQEQLSQVPWVCGGSSGKNCPKPNAGASSWLIPLIVAGVMLLLGIAAVLLMRRKNRLAQAREPILGSDGAI